MTKQDFIERPCVGWDEENKKCKFGHNPNGALLCRGNIAFNIYEEGRQPAYNLRLPDCINED